MNDADKDIEEFDASARVPFPEKPIVLEERNGEISFQSVNNDNQPRRMIILTVYDRTYLSTAIVKRPPIGSHADKSDMPGEVDGGITCRPFKGRQYAEIVFALSPQIRKRKVTEHI
ncbi:hypothetical protein KC356_g9248 [Hortaea werneckii]|nr:hypothetical protein KC342_g17723 [Hortaea werneckii]KAI6855207.1 hypothetical protein KC338_g8956 [Hortaea werneckii]KAI7081235.1 hypothetical protein KC356_g9248 [Hortaea werneckii]KAI7460105.1 hypothetical protein KC357_g9055 [Hortaea werneckii]KAI7547755.1 hypothetical protein KC331_g4821 [Hortaea werneckii]